MSGKCGPRRRCVPGQDVLVRIERSEGTATRRRVGPSDSELDRVVQAWTATGGPSSVESVVELRGGLYNSCFGLLTGGGGRAVLRVAPAESDQRPSERHLLRNEYASVPFLRPIADLIPSTLFADFTHQVIDRDYLIQSHLDGVPALRLLNTWSEANQHLFWRSLGSILARVHSTTGDRFGRLSDPSALSWSSYLAAEFDLIAAGCDELGLDATDLRTVADLVRTKHRDALEQVTTGHLLHGDLTPANVMIDPAHPERGIIGVLDCDRTWWGDPAADWTFTYLDRVSDHVGQAFWSGYGEDLPSDGAARQRGLMYRLRALGEIRLEYARLARSDKLPQTYTKARDLIGQLG